jgi:hypothetical protein
MIGKSYVRWREKCSCDVDGCVWQGDLFGCSGLSIETGTSPIPTSKGTVRHPGISAKGECGSKLLMFFLQYRRCLQTLLAILHRPLR